MLSRSATFPTDILFAGILLGTSFAALDAMRVSPYCGCVRSRDLTLLLGLAPGAARRIFNAWRADRGIAERYYVQGA